MCVLSRANANAFSKDIRLPKIASAPHTHTQPHTATHSHTRTHRPHQIQSRRCTPRIDRAASTCARSCGTCRRPSRTLTVCAWRATETVSSARATPSRRQAAALAASRVAHSAAQPPSFGLHIHPLAHIGTHSHPSIGTHKHP